MKLDEEQTNIFIENINILKKLYSNNKKFFNDIGIDESLLTHWNKRKRRPSFNTICKICEKLNINIVDIVNKRIKARIIVEFEDEEGV